VELELDREYQEMLVPMAVLAAVQKHLVLLMLVVLALLDKVTMADQMFLRKLLHLPQAAAAEQGLLVKMQPILHLVL
jgi:hypothetical protein